MSSSHGDLFSEIGKLVLAAHAGQAIDLDAKSAELAQRYCDLDVPAESIAKAISRSIGAIGFSMAAVNAKGQGLPDQAHANGHSGVDGSNGNGSAHNGHMNGANGNGHAAPEAVNGNGQAAAADEEPHLPPEDEYDIPLESDQVAKLPKLFPSGVRLALLS